MVIWTSAYIRSQLTASLRMPNASPTIPRLRGGRRRGSGTRYHVSRGLERSRADRSSPADLVAGDAVGLVAPANATFESVDLQVAKESLGRSASR